MPDGRSVVPAIRALLSLPFALRVATKDHHPPGHVSFAANHAGARPFADRTTVANPANPEETYETRLWPVHCVQGTPGNAIVAELDDVQFDKVVLKGTDPRVEMYSAFRSPLRDPPLASAVSDLDLTMREAGIQRVVIVGLAGDYCVMSSAMDAKDLGWETYVVEEGTKCVGGDEGWESAKREMEAVGVSVVNLEWAKEVCISAHKCDCMLTILLQNLFR